MTNNKNAKLAVNKISQNGIDLIKCWEGLRLKAYKCPANVWTIGYGHTKTAKAGMTITNSQADKLLLEDLKGYEAAVNTFTIVLLTQNQFDALVSFTFNVGIGAFRKSTLLRLVNQGRFKEASNQFDRWVFGGGKQLPGLIARREAEKTMFLR